MIHQSANGLIEYIVVKYLAAVKEPQTRAKIWINVLLDMSVDNLPGIATFIDREELAHGRLAGKSENPEYQLLQLDASPQVEAAYLQRISEILKETSLLNISFRMPAYLWESFDLSGYQQYISSELKKSNANKCRFIAGYASEWKSLTSYAEVGWCFEPSTFEKYLSVEEAHSAVGIVFKMDRFFPCRREYRRNLLPLPFSCLPLLKKKKAFRREKRSCLYPCGGRRKHWILSIGTK